MELKEFFTSKTTSLWKKRNQNTAEQKIGIELYYYSEDRLEKQEDAKLSDVSGNMPEWATNMWVNIEGIDEAVIHKLATTFKLHPLAIEDVIETDSRPKLDWYDQTLFMLTHIITAGPTAPGTGIFSLMTEQVSFFLIGHILVTIQEGLPGDIWTAVRQGLDTAGSAIRRGDAGFLLYELFAGIVDTCDPIMDSLGDLLEDLEVAMLERPSKKMNRLVYLIKRHLMTLRSTLLPTKKIIQKLITSVEQQQQHQSHQAHIEQPHQGHEQPHQGHNEQAHQDQDHDHAHGEGAELGTMSRRQRKMKSHHHSLSASTVTYLRDLLSELTEMAEKLEHQRELANSLSGLYGEYQAQLQGDVSYVIALVSVFFLPLTFIAGVYGMNFTILPELQWELGYLYVWMLFLGIVLFEVFLFWRVGWISFGTKIDYLFSCQKRPAVKDRRRLKMEVKLDD